MKYFIIFLSIILSTASGHAQYNSAHPFDVIPLGVKGGIDESNLSSYLLSVRGSDVYICLDAGTLYSGLEKAVKHGIFHQPPTVILKSKIKGYLISHPHLDHVAGLILNSPEDSNKNIYALPFCLKVLEKNYFTWESWANFGDKGELPQLKKYHYVTVEENKEMELADTKMFVQPFLLSHSKPGLSTAFLIRHDSSYILYVGDTGADSIEKSNCLQQVWQWVAPLIVSKKLKAIFIEVSFPDSQPVDKLFGHLTPHLLMQEMQQLSTFCSAKALKYFPIVITHIKPGINNEQIIKKELIEQNKLRLNIIFPEQGWLLNF